LHAFKKEQGKNGKVAKQKGISSAEFEIKKRFHREKWLQIVRENSDKGRLELRRLAKYTCVWLCKNDREWREKNTPAKKYVQAHSNVDWEARDKVILKCVRQTVQKILESDDKPQRISLLLIKTRPGLKSFDLQLDKLALTKTFVNSVIETPVDLHKRQIQWAIRKLKEEGKDFGIYTIVDMVGAGNRYRKQAVEEVKRVLENI